MEINDSFIAERLTKLRIEKGVSEFRMSYDMGHSSSYINTIALGKAMPSMGEFLYMCEYLGVTPSEFFAEDISDPVAHNELTEESKKLSEKDFAMVLDLVKRLNEK